MYSDKKYTSKKKLGSYPSVSVVFSITLALFAIGVFGALVIYSKELEKVVKENIRLQVYLNSKVSTRILKKSRRILSQRILLPSNQRQSSLYLKKKPKNNSSKKQAKISKAFLANRLHDAFLIRVDEPYQSKSNLAKIKSEL
ncbi:MAG: hypothetical protein QM734_00555 [Cyclobacteriaceae bacterium]